MNRPTVGDGHIVNRELQARAADEIDLLPERSAIADILIGYSVL